MYGGYDGSASQFAGQGGFLPTPAGGATAGADGAAGGAVRTLERRSSRRVSRPRRTPRGGDDPPARSRLPPDRYRATRACVGSPPTRIETRQPGKDTRTTFTYNGETAPSIINRKSLHEELRNAPSKLVLKGATPIVGLPRHQCLLPTPVNVGLPGRKKYVSDVPVQCRI